MRLSAVLGLGALALVLVACERSDPLAANRRACADADRVARERVAACTAIIESGELNDSERADAHANRGAAQRADGDVTAALRDFEAALRLAPEQAAALEGRAGILIASGQLDAAEPLVDRLIAAGHGLAQAHLMKGQIRAQRGEYEAAIASYTSALDQDGRLASAFALRGRARQRLDDAEGALADYAAAIEIDQNIPDARSGRCWLTLRGVEDRPRDQREGALAHARADAAAAVAADPRHVEAQLCSGVLDLRRGEWAQAQAAFEAALAVEPGNPIALFGRGVARRRSGDAAGREDMNLARDFDRRIGETFDDFGVETY